LVHVERGRGPFDYGRRANRSTTRHAYVTESSVPDSSSSTGTRVPIVIVCKLARCDHPETETAFSSRYVLPKDVDATIRHLDDQQLARLVSVALEERAWRKNFLCLRKVSANEVPKPFLPLCRKEVERRSDSIQNRRYAARIAREFGSSRTDACREC
jgi:hypothetical protein